MLWHLLLFLACWQVCSSWQTHGGWLHTLNVPAIRVRMSLSASSSLQGFQNFVRTNPLSDKISALRFHHVEFYCGDARTTYSRFLLGLGMDLAAKSDQSTGNTDHASYALASGDMRMLFTAPYNASSCPAAGPNAECFPGFKPETAHTFCLQHGLGVRAIAIEVSDVAASYASMMGSGGLGVLPPRTVRDSRGRGTMDIAEVSLYGDVVLRLVSTVGFTGAFLPNFEDVQRRRPDGGYGITRFDHVVGNLWTLQPTISRIKRMTGFHDFAEFVADDVGTVDSGLNSVVLANNNEMVLLPLNEPTFGTKRKSQIQTFLEQNNGEGVQHIALFSSDIFATMERMRANQHLGGFEFMDPPSNPAYYSDMRARLGDSLSEEQFRRIEALGLLADKDDQGVLLQIFTRPVGDRPTLFLEIIQRVGCESEAGQKPGCGGFGKGNFKDLFRSIEDYEATLKI